LSATSTGTCTAYKTVLANFNTVMAANVNRPANLSSILGQAVRLAFHDAAEIDIRSTTDTLGPDGCLSKTKDNAGLVEASSKVLTVLEPIWQSVCDKISRADFWAMFAKLSVEYAAGGTANINIPYYFGRVDKRSCAVPVSRLPSAQQGMTMLETVFESQMGLTLTDAVTLLGAHTLGHVHTAHSGYGAPGINPANSVAVNSWDGTPAVFDNAYYNKLLNIPWRNTGAVTNNNGSVIDTWVNGGANTIMLNSDMNLAYAIDTSGTNNVGTNGQRCVTTSGVPTCGNPTSTTGPATTTGTFNTVVAYAASNAAFLAGFAASFPKMTAVGYSVTGVSTTPKSPSLGTLTPITLTSC